MDKIWGQSQHIPNATLPVRIVLYILNICEYAMVCECVNVQGFYEWVKDGM